MSDLLIGTALIAVCIVAASLPLWALVRVLGWYR